MILSLFSIYDKKVGAFSAPMMMRSKGEAIRSFTDAVGDAKSEFCRHPEDYLLNKIGEFDDNSGVVTPMLEPVISALECRRIVDQE